MEDGKYEIKIYKIWYDDDPDEFYIGSTKEQRLSNRMTAHRRDGNNNKPCRISQLIHTKGNDFQYVQIASCMVSSSDEQRLFEQHWIDRLKPPLNQRRAHTDMKEYKKKYMREYYHTTKKVKQARYSKAKYETTKDIRTCICGVEYNYGFLSARYQHFRSKGHQNYVQGLPFFN